MKLASRKIASPIEQRRDRRLHDRERAPPLRQLFPQLGLVRLEMVFADPTHAAPSSQAHTFTGQPALFFRFACPCFDCDGESI
jgi:hypothetical protein